MIQFRRGKTSSWENSSIKLAAGQPGYDTERHKIKIGDGVSTWASLPDVSGLTTKEILDSEAAAKTRKDANSKDTTLITYGTTAPNANTVGQLYLRQSTTDHIVDAGISEGWVYQVYGSGIIKCYGTFEVELDITDAIEGTGLYCSSGDIKKTYPKTFKHPPSETASIQSAHGIAWLANKGANTTGSSGNYAVVSTASNNDVKYTISIQAVGIKP